MSLVIPSGYYPFILIGVHADAIYAFGSQDDANLAKTLIERSPARCFSYDASDQAPGMFFVFKEWHNGELRVYSSSTEMCATSPGEAYAKAAAVLSDEAAMHATPIGIMWFGAMPELTLH